MTFSPSTRGVKILPSSPPSPPCTEGIDPGARLSQIDSGDNIVHTKHWLFNEISVARFHLAPPVRGPVIPLPFQPQAPLDPIGATNFQD